MIRSNKSTLTSHRPIVALAGGVGGAKLTHGLAQILPPEDLTIIVNTGDDFVHWGLNVSPDLDTVCYALAGIAHPTTGWGRADESWQVFENAVRLGAPDWFRLGDRDLGTHLERTRRLQEGQPLSRVTRDFCRAWGVEPAVLPMSDQPVHTMVDTVEDGELAFQEYFVHRRCEPQVKGFRFDGIEKAVPAEGLIEAVKSASAVVICPSNPWVSIDPILAVAGIRAELIRRRDGEGLPIAAVSPIVAGSTIKGPAAKMYRELGIEPSALAVAGHYRGLITHFILDRQDAGLQADVPTLAVDSIMNTPADRHRLAEDVLHFIGR